jgi:hypothetical protein
MGQPGAEQCGGGAGAESVPEMSRPTSINCAWCGDVVPLAPEGPIPMYCCRRHGQMAYESRRAERIRAEIAGVPSPETRPKTVNCAWCGKVVPVAATGPLPKYCGRAHGQLAYSKRRAERLDAEITSREARTQAALDVAEAKVKSLARALRFYADPLNYAAPGRRARSETKKSGSAVDQDGGRRATKALNKVRKSG